ncbi:MAG: hypothetical protein ABR924_10210 [Terracidiphilus sp.]|jgi:hypothetical protein
MTNERKSPQEKKFLELTKDHFTVGFRSTRTFPKTWKRKKAHANREYRRKSEELLVQAKPGIAGEDVSLVADDLTAARFQKSVVRKPLKKVGTITVGERIKLGLARRKDMAGRRLQRQETDRQAATLAISTLSSLEGERLVDFVRRAGVLCGAMDAKEAARMQLSKDPVDQALHFIYRIAWGLNSPAGAVCRDPELCKALAAWEAKANRILRHDRRVIEAKAEQKQMNEKKLKALRRAM